MLSHSSNPEWEELFEILVADEVDDISFTVKDDNWIGLSLGSLVSSRASFSKQEKPCCSVLLKYSC